MEESAGKRPLQINGFTVSQLPQPLVLHGLVSSGDSWLSGGEPSIAVGVKEGPPLWEPALHLCNFPVVSQMLAPMG